MTHAACLLLFLSAVPDTGTPMDLSTARAHFLRGDLSIFLGIRARAIDRGAPVDRGAFGLLDDLTRLVRCLPLGALPEHEAQPYVAVRLVVRLERARLESLIRDGEYADTSLADLFGAPSLYRIQATERASAVVRWPNETERWPDEVVDADAEPSRCPLAPGAPKEVGAERRIENTRLRAQAIRAAVAQILRHLEHLPGDPAAKIAFTYLQDASRARDFKLPESWDRTLEGALDRGPPPYRSAGHILLARLREASGRAEQARALYRKILLDEARDPDEDSRVRARLVGLEEPDWERVLAIVRGARGARPSEAPVFANAEARALYALDRWGDLQTFGRAWLQETPTEDDFGVATRALLVRLGLKMPVGAAIDWMSELAADDPTRRAAQLDELGRLAIQLEHLELATAIYDRLLIEATNSRDTVGPGALVDAARWIAARALVEFVRRDSEAFAGFIDDLVQMARREHDRPLARQAPHREIARLSQDLMGRLTNEIPERSERRKFAAILLEASAQLAPTGGRWSGTIVENALALRALAGPYAETRAPALGAEPPAGAPKTTGKRARPRNVRQLGEVLVPRLPPRLEASDVPTEIPGVSSFLVYQLPDGTWSSGAPWADLADERRAKRASGIERAARTGANP